jgi:uncharacterized surface protein with fasciclin (FAS1) repeats
MFKKLALVTLLAIGTATSAYAAAKENIVQIATTNPQFKTLAAALKAAGLDKTLEGAGPFTVFAPTDAAFAKIPKATLDDLLKPENKDKLTKILTFHVVPGAVVSKDLAGKKSNPKTVEGGELAIDATGAHVMVDGAKVEGADVMATNGVIHIIDTVLMPKS